MSFLHSHSEACLKSELDIFSLPPTQTAIESSTWVSYKPVSSLTDESPIEFCVLSKRRLSRFGSHHAKSECANYSGQCGHRQICGTRQQFITLYVQPDRCLFQLETRVATQQRLSLQSVYRDIVELRSSG